jgi:adenosylcobinamide kinase/adenosylcobinamide-phosphate guanylyltransferase
MRELILGGVRSGKSRYAENQAVQAEPQAGQQVVYIATAGASGDSEMAQRIAAHRERRPDHWRTIEAPLELPEAIAAHCTRDKTVLVDCLTLWLSNLLGGTAILDEPSDPSPGKPTESSHDSEDLLEETVNGPADRQTAHTLHNRTAHLLEAVEQASGRLLLVSNETGFGVVPNNALARRFCDEAGNLHQALAQRCERVTLIVAGMPLSVK